MLDLNLGSLIDVFAFRKTVYVLYICIYVLYTNRNGTISMYSVLYFLV